MQRRDLRFLSNQVRQRQKNLQEVQTDIPVVETVIECPVCKRQMTLRRHAQYGLFWGCDSYASCGTSHGARPDGTPLGEPATRETKEWRVRAHAAFDPLWQSGKLTRNEAYDWLCQVMNKTLEKGHIALFSVEECQQLIEHVKARSRSQLRTPER